MGINPPTGNALSHSLAGGSVCHLSAFSIESNVANLTSVPSQIAVNAQNYFGVAEYNKVLLISNITLEQSAFGFSIRNDQGNIKHRSIQIAFCKKLNEHLSMGISLLHHRFKSHNVFYQTYKMVTFNVGISYQVSQRLSIGAQVTNPKSSPITNTPTEFLPSHIRLGARHSISPNIKAYFDAVLTDNLPLLFCSGIELNNDAYKIRCGFNNQQTFGFGISILESTIEIDLGILFHNALGLSPSINCNYAW